MFRIKKRFVLGNNPYEYGLYVNDAPEGIGMYLFQGINGFRYVTFDVRKQDYTKKEFNNIDDAKHFMLWSYVNGHYV